MRRLMVLLVFLGLLATMGASVAQQKAASDVVGAGAITILTDGIADPQGEVSMAVGQLAQRVSAVGKLRVLPVMGQGGTANVRDLLHLRGVDFAVLNSDILAYVDLFGGYPEAKRRIRYVAPLFDEKVYLIARKRVGSVQDLSKGKVMVFGQDSPGFTTAMTLFGLLRIDVEVTSWGSAPTLTADAMGDADAALVVGRELARVRFDQNSLSDLHVLAIPLTPRLAGVYRLAKLGQSDIPGMVPADGIDTLQVTTLLAVFDWTSMQSVRQQPVANFIKAFLTVLPEMQRSQPWLWKGTDINAPVPGWERYGPADTLRKSVKPVVAGPEPAVQPRLPQVAALAPRSRPDAKLPWAPPAQSAIPKDGAELTRSLRIAIGSRPPLTDANAPGGGLITELLAAGLQTATSPAGMKIVWSNSRSDQLDALLGGQPVDVALPWETPDCDRPNDLAVGSAVVCDRMLLSDPIFQVIVGLFVRADGEFKFESDESVANRVFCVQRDTDTSDFDRGGRNWLAQRRITLVRADSFIECLGLVERREADAAVANELEGRFTLERLGLAPGLRMLDRPFAMRGIHAVVAKDHPRANELLQSINEGLAQLKIRGAYVDLVKKHVLGFLMQQNSR